MDLSSRAYWFGKPYSATQFNMAGQKDAVYIPLPRSSQINYTDQQPPPQYSLGTYFVDPKTMKGKVDPLEFELKTKG